jgi:uncharacterized membrane protein
MKKRYSSYVMAIIGLILLSAGLYILKTIDAPQGILRALSYVCIGFGCGMFGHGLGDVISRRSLKNSPDIAKQMDIERNDERNIAIGNRAKAKSYDLMVSVYGALLVAFGLMGVEMAVILLLVAAYLSVCGYSIYYRCRYDKEM